MMKYSPQLKLWRSKRESCSICKTRNSCPLAITMSPLTQRSLVFIQTSAKTRRVPRAQTSLSYWKQWLTVMGTWKHWLRTNFCSAKRKSKDFWTPTRFSKLWESKSRSSICTSRSLTSRCLLTRPALPSKTKVKITLKVSRPKLTSSKLSWLKKTINWKTHNVWTKRLKQNSLKLRKKARLLKKTIWEWLRIWNRRLCRQSSTKKRYSRISSKSKRTQSFFPWYSRLNAQ